MTGDGRFSFESKKTGEKPMDLALEDMFGNSPKTVLIDKNLDRTYAKLCYDSSLIVSYIKDVLRLEAVACKDWLTNKVDRCVGGKVSTQQCVGPLQLPLNNCGVMALDYSGTSGIATSIGHAPLSTLIDPAAGSKNAIAEAFTNIIWAPLEKGIKSVSLSANWMWPCKNEGEDARLYKAVEAVSEFAIALGVNVPTGKDSLSMAQKYPDETVLAPGTCVISAAGHCDAISQVVEPVLSHNGAGIYYINMSGDSFKLGGSSFAQTQNKIGIETPTIKDAKAFAHIFDTVQDAIRQQLILAGHDISAGGLITAILEMCFADNEIGASLDLNSLNHDNLVELLFSENAGILVQANDVRFEEFMQEHKVQCTRIGAISTPGLLSLKHQDSTSTLNISELRDVWYETSYLLDQKQCANDLATKRYENYSKQSLKYLFPGQFNGKLNTTSNTTRPKAAIIREKGSNSEREMANAMYQAGFDVKDVHMTDLIAGREDLSDIQFIGAVGGFSNSDVLGSAKGWAGAFKYNDKAKTSLKKFFEREDTLSIGICNGCQLFLELDLINPDHEQLAKMTFNDSHKHESSFTSVQIQENNSVMMSSMVGATLGVWISHGEGKFNLPMDESAYKIVGKYGHVEYPANPNGSDYNAAMLVSDDGRHLVTMPHIERSFYPWNWAYYPEGRKDTVSPWAEAFENARDWCLSKLK